MKRAVRPRRTFLARGGFRVVANFSVMSTVPLRVCLNGIRSSLSPSGPGTTEPEFYATPSNKVAKLPKAVMPQSRGDGVKAEGHTVIQPTTGDLFSETRARRWGVVWWASWSSNSHRGSSRRGWMQRSRDYGAVGLALMEEPTAGNSVSSGICCRSQKRTENEDGESIEDRLAGRRSPRGRDTLDAARDRPWAPIRRSR